MKMSIISARHHPTTTNPLRRVAVTVLRRVAVEVSRKVVHKVVHTRILMTLTITQMAVHLYLVSQKHLPSHLLVA
jgi:hypothetical protein